MNKFFKEDLVLSNAEDSGSARAPDLTSQSPLAGETCWFHGRCSRPDMLLPRMALVEAPL